MAAEGGAGRAGSVVGGGTEDGGAEEGAVEDGDGAGAAVTVDGAPDGKTWAGGCTTPPARCVWARTVARTPASGTSTPTTHQAHRGGWWAAAAGEAGLPAVA
ncbi:hypothetical protein [Streptomyces sp. NPDC058326]|uniref:hypothetical protein n=1 Tax=Streptomyces sp. NPDC058326 TaxID=3346447 RepID=UPI0036E68AF5